MNAQAPWGRVADDGSVFVRTSDGERLVGQWPGGDPAEALALYTRRFDGLTVEVELLERRIAQGALAPDQAVTSIAAARDAIDGAQAVGDLDALLHRLDALAPLLEEQRAKRKAAKAEQQTASRVGKERLVAEAEGIAAGHDWRAGSDRLRTLLDTWKALPRLDRRTDDELWHRFSSARSTHTRRRKQHFAEVGEKRAAAKVVKRRLVSRAEALSGSTDWGPTSKAYRDLMQEWKAAGPAGRGDDDVLWKQFRDAQDVFFRARDAANTAQDEEYAANAAHKRAVLAEAEKLLPVTDPVTARAAFRPLAQRWDEAGKVPRDDVRDLEQGIKAVEDAISAAEDDRWERSNPEAQARAADTVAKLEASLRELEASREKAAAAGQDTRVREAEQAIQARRSWLEQARQALTDFTP
ncbi:MAG: DUF349 domain-containing protein [Actinomycetota bacterium]|nr:DUF349 domain-containing protein [Actinomycetota bacterium]